MATVARRTQTRPAANTTTKRESSGYRGDEGMRRMKEEETKQAALREAAKMNMNMPFRFRASVGESREIVVVDDKPDWFRYEHNLKDNRTGKYTIFCACINENSNCPVCKGTDRQPYYAMFLTCIDLTPYENKAGDTVDWSKKLLVVKLAQQKKFQRLYEREGTLRGMILSMTRDGEKDATIGNDIEFVEFMSEEELLEYETEYTYEQQGKKMTKTIIGHEPFDYDELFPRPTEQQLRAIVGGRPEPGSREDEHQAIGRSSRRGGRDDWDGDAEEKPAVRRARPARSAVADEEIPEGAEDAQDADPVEAEDPPPRRAASRAAVSTRPAARPAARPAVREAAPPQRLARRAAQPDPEPADDAPDDDAPPEEDRQQSLAERRRRLRR